MVPNAGQKTSTIASIFYTKSIERQKKRSTGLALYGWRKVDRICRQTINSWASYLRKYQNVPGHFCFEFLTMATRKKLTFTCVPAFDFFPPPLAPKMINSIMIIKCSGVLSSNKLHTRLMKQIIKTDEREF